MLSLRSFPRLLTATRARCLTTAAQSALFQRLSIASTPSSPLHGVYNGLWRATGPIITSINPSTGAVLAHVREGSKADVEETLVRARAAYRDWRDVPAPVRGMVLRKIRERLEERKEDLGRLISLEMGKIESEGKGEWDVRTKTRRD